MHTPRRLRCLELDAWRSGEGIVRQVLLCEGFGERDSQSGLDSAGLDRHRTATISAKVATAIELMAHWRLLCSPPRNLGAIPDFTVDPHEQGVATCARPTLSWALYGI